MFGKDEDDHSYCIHASSLISEKDLKGWKFLELGMNLAIRPEKSINENHNDSSSETRIVN